MNFNNITEYYESDPLSMTCLELSFYLQDSCKDCLLVILDRVLRATSAAHDPSP